MIYLQTASRMHHWLSQHNLIHLAHSCPAANRMKILYSWQKNQGAGKQLFYGFMRCNNELSMKKPEATSLSQATGFNWYSLFFFIYICLGFWKNQIYSRQNLPSE
jgi:hypothetical protein